MKILVKNFEEKDFGHNYYANTQLKIARIITITDPSCEGYFGDDLGKWVRYLFKISLFQFQKIRGNDIEPENHKTVRRDSVVLILANFLKIYKIFYINSYS